MKKNKLILLATLTLMLAACSDEGKKMDADTEAAFLQQLIETQDLQEMRDLIDQKKPSMSEHGMLAAVDTYVQRVTQEADAATSSASVFEDEFYSQSEQTWRDYEGDEDLEFLFAEVEKLPVILFGEGDYFSFMPDFDAIAEDFKDDVHPGLIAYFEFTGSEQDVHYFDSKEQMLELDIVRERIQVLDQYLEEYEGTPLEDSFHMSRSFYSALYFGTNHMYFVEEGILKEEVREHYRETADMDLSISGVMDEYLAKIEEHGWDPNEPNVLVWLMDNELLESGTEGIPITEDNEATVEEGGTEAGE